MKVIKRDGLLVDYDESRIRNAIEQAFKAEMGYYNIDLCSKLAKEVTSKLAERSTDEYEVEYIQDTVEKTLMKHNLYEVAKGYITYRNDRTRIREMNSGIMKQMYTLTFSDASAVDLKRENANIDGDTAMGTMLRYGSEVAKAFNFNYLVDKEISQAHRNGDIHIHDADFMSLTETCLVGDVNIQIRDNTSQIDVTMSYFDKFYTENEEGTKELQGTFIKELDNKYVPVINCSRHKVKPTEKVYLLELSNSKILKATDKHKIPKVLNKAQAELVHIEDLEPGDSVYYCEDTNIIPTVITNKTEIDYQGYVYDIETSTNYFLANNILVHNCCQIDLKKLFTGGFNTGHGYVREPGEIRSYAALACIALQSNQNEMH